MLFIFDWDGTLSDSTQRIIECMHRAAEAQKLPLLIDGAVRDIIGLGLPEAIRTLYPDLRPEAVEAMRGAYAEHFIAADTTPSAFYPNVEATLDELLQGGHQIAVATGKSRAGLDRILSSTGLHGLFHATRCADETHSKPHPRMLHELLQELSVPAAEAVMIGDTEFDMDMARRAHMARIAVDYGAHHISRLQTYEPLLCVSDIGRVMDILDD